MASAIRIRNSGKKLAEALKQKRNNRYSDYTKRMKKAIKEFSTDVGGSYVHPELDNAVDTIITMTGSVRKVIKSGNANLLKCNPIIGSIHYQMSHDGDDMCCDVYQVEFEQHLEYYIRTALELLDKVLVGYSFRG